jgi:hypothetical protein
MFEVFVDGLLNRACRKSAFEHLCMEALYVDLSNRADESAAEHRPNIQP